jgi:hypothetical protein
MLKSMMSSLVAFFLPLYQMMRARTIIWRRLKAGVYRKGEDLKAALRADALRMVVEYDKGNNEPKAPVLKKENLGRELYVRYPQYPSRLTNLSQIVHTRHFKVHGINQIPDHPILREAPKDYSPYRLVYVPHDFIVEAPSPSDNTSMRPVPRQRIVIANY